MEYNEELCKEKHSNIKESQCVQDKRLDSHSDRIDRVEDAIVILKTLLEKMENKKVPWPETSWGKRIIDVLIWLLVALAITALAKNANISLFKGAAECQIEQYVGFLFVYSYSCFS